MAIPTAVFGFCLACLLCLGFTPLVARLSGVVMRRDGSTSTHPTTTPIEDERPNVGGLAIYASIVVTLIVALLLYPNWRDGAFPTLAIGIVLAGGLVVVLGLIDDLQGSRPWKKLLTQCVAVLLLQIYVDALGLGALMVGGWHLALTLLVLLWMLGLTNAMNLIDGLDGLAAGVAALGGAALAVAAAVLGLGQPALIAAAVAGASLGFLRRNAPPASIIMGDTGSMFLGFALAGVGAAIFWSAPSARTLLGLLLISWVPALDASYAVVRRWARGESIFRGDRGHIHHRLLSSGFSTRGAALSLCGLALLGSVAGVATILHSNAALWTTTLLMASLPLAWILRPQSAARRQAAHTEAARKGTVTQDRAA